MTRLILLWALSGDQWAQSACERIGGVVGSIDLHSRLLRIVGVDPWDLETLELLEAGIISEAEASLRNQGRWEP